LLYAPRASRLRITELTVSEERIVRDRLPNDEPCTAVGIYDLEGELFFGAAPTLESHLEGAARKAREQLSRHIVLRLKRVRNPDAVCLERLEHFLREAQRQGLVVLLAGVREDLQGALERLRFADWFPSAQIFAEEDEADSSTLKAVRAAYQMLGDDNACEHCKSQSSEQRVAKVAYYLV
jgi:SulP family sulfate permease